MIPDYIREQVLNAKPPVPPCHNRAVAELGEGLPPVRSTLEVHPARYRPKGMTVTLPRFTAGSGIQMGLPKTTDIGMRCVFDYKSGQAYYLQRQGR